MLSTLKTFAIDYDYTYEPLSTANDSWFSGGAGTFTGFVALAVTIVMIAAMWRILTKAGRPGWAAIIPFYNTLQLLWMVQRPWWWLLLMFIPFVNVIVLVVVYYNLAKAFGKGVGYTLLFLLLPFIGFPMLAWGDAKYKLKKPASGR